jgi:multidrug efflux pump subunit AcrA (membrane-fusion protein)
MKTIRSMVSGLGLAFVIASPGTAQEEIKLHEVMPQFFQMVETLDATVESTAMAPVAADTRNWTSLKVKSVVPEGTAVKKGDVLAEFDTEDLELKIHESKQSIELGSLTLQGSEIELRQLDKTIALDTALAERKLRNAEQDYQYFVDVERPNTEKTTERSVQNSVHSLEYSQEEYNQLKRMYEEDELTEESEEIVLKRTQRDVENSQFYLEQAQMRAARSLQYDLPRTMEQKTDELERARLEFERSKVNLPIEREKKSIAFEKARFALDKEKRDLDKLTADLDRMVLKAPADGIVYYGRCDRGAWVGPAGPSRDIEVGKTVPNDKTLMTIIDPAQLMLRADLSEKQLALLRTENPGWAIPAAFPDVNLQVSVKSIGRVPVAADKFDCQLLMRKALAGLMPGMKCKVRFVIRENDAALTVPESAVFSDDGFSRYVFVGESGAGEGDVKFVKRPVKTGFTVDKMTEVLEGLKSGEKVATSRPLKVDSP